jgi:hypothetical protein
VSELHRDLSRKARVFSPALDLRPGDDALRVTSQALRDAGIVVLLLGRGADLDPTLGDELQRAVTRRRSDPTRPFVPVYLDAHTEAHPLYGTATTRGLALHALGRDAVVRSLHELAVSLRAQWNARARVAVVSIEAELGDVARAVAGRLGALTAVESATVIDAAHPDALTLARKADLQLVLAGVRTGRTSALRELIGGGAPALKMAQVDPSRIVIEEFVEAQSLLAKIDARESFATAEEAAGRAQDALAVWIKTWAAASPGGGPALEPWERAWLSARRTKWRAGSHEGLREASRGRSLDRARLYVSLRAEATESMHVDADGQLVVRDRAAENFPLERMRGEGERGAPWLESLVSHRALPSVVVEAEAGSGKTVLVQHVACVLAAMHLGEPVAEHHLDRGALEEGAPLLRVPVLIEAPSGSGAFRGTGARASGFGLWFVVSASTRRLKVRDRRSVIRSELVAPGEHLHIVERESHAAVHLQLLALLGRLLGERPGGRTNRGTACSCRRAGFASMEVDRDDGCFVGSRGLDADPDPRGPTPSTSSGHRPSNVGRVERPEQPGQPAR